MPRSAFFGMLACARSVAGYIDHVIPWRVQFYLRAGFWQPFSSPLALPLGLLGFSPLMFSVWRVPVPFLSCGGSWLACAVVPVMGALFQSRGLLPIVEAPGYFRHPTSILAIQLLTYQCLIIRWIVLDILLHGIWISNETILVAFDV